MFLDRLIDRLAGQGPVLKPSVALAEELANPIWETSPSDEVREASDLDEIEPRSQSATGRRISKSGKPHASDNKPPVSHDPLVQFEPSKQNAEIPAPASQRIVGEGTPVQNEPPRQPRMQEPKPAEKMRLAPVAVTASIVENHLVRTRQFEPENPQTPVMHLVPPANEHPDIPEKPAPRTQADPPIPPTPVQDSADFEVTVHIGQIETVAPPPSPPAPKSAVRKRLPQPMLSLQDYIERRRGGAR